MTKSDSARWDEKWAVHDEPRPPHHLLVSHQQDMRGGTAVDIACGLGQNARWLAQHGYRVLALDISLVALTRARALADQRGLSTDTLFVQYDLDHWSAPAASIDLICVIRFLDRTLFPKIKRVLSPGGLLFYETRHMALLNHQPDANAKYLLEPGELLEQFGNWDVLFHHEGPKNVSLVARRPD